MDEHLSNDAGHPGWLRKAVSWLALVAPAVAAVFYVRLNSVDVPFWDQWELVPMLDRALDGRLTFRDLWTQHNEHRIVIPRLLMIGLAQLSSWDVRWEMYASLIVLVATSAMILRSELPSSKARWSAILLLLPVSLVLFSWRQWENFLWGWQVQFFLCIFFATSAFSFLAASRMVRLSEGAAMLCAVASTLSLSAGFAAWPAGLAALWLSGRGSRRQRVSRALRWTAAGLLCLACYLWGYSRPTHHPDPKYIIRNPVAGLDYLLVLLGGPFAEEQGRAIVSGAILLGFTVVALAAIARAHPDASLSLPTALIVYAGVSLLMITVGRAGFGDAQAQASRYVTMDGILIVGVYLVLLREVRSGGVMRAATLACFVGFVLGGILASQPEAWKKARAWRAERLFQQGNLRCFRTGAVSDLAGIYFSPDRVRELAPLLEKHGLSSFRHPCRTP